MKSGPQVLSKYLFHPKHISDTKLKQKQKGMNPYETCQKNPHKPPKPNSPKFALRLSAKLRKKCCHVLWFCGFQLSDTMLRNALFCKTCPAQEGTGNTEIRSRQVLSFSLAVPTGAVGGCVVSQAIPCTPRNAHDSQCLS